MKHQYVGDISDYRKYALLRALSDEGKNQIGVCWMLTEPDGRSDGNKLSYLGQADRFRHFDPPLFDELARSAAVPDQRRLHTIEDSGIVPGAVYFNATIPDAKAGRNEFMSECRKAFRDVNLVFFDPDNGLDIASKAKGHRGSSKFLYVDEITPFWDEGKSVLIYQHFPRVERRAFVAACFARLSAVAPGAVCYAYTTSHVVFLLLLHPQYPPGLAQAVDKACGRWPDTFMTGSLLHGEDAVGVANT